MPFARLSLVLAATIIHGCVAIQTYPGPMLPDDQIAKIVPKIGVYGVAGKEVAVVSFDGGAVSEPYAVMEILPGRHLVGLRYEGATLSVVVRNAEPCYVVIDAQAGVHYHVNGEYDVGEDSWRCWFTNTKTDERTAGVFLQGAMPERDQLPALMDAIVQQQSGRTNGGTSMYVNTALGLMEVGATAKP